MAHHAGRLITFLSIAIALGACRRDVVTGTPDISASADNGLDITIAPSSATLEPDHTLQFTATVRARGGEVVENAPVTWSSSDPSVATVTSAGLVTAVATGDVTIGASFANQSASAAVRVEVVLRNVIIFTNDSNRFGDIMVMNPDGSGRRLLTSDGAGYASPVISPDGRTVAFMAYNGHDWNLDLMNADGGNRRLLAHRSDFDNAPTWSPDGSQIAFSSMIRGPFGEYGRIFVINVDGTGLHQVSPEETDPNTYSYDGGSTWSPDGRRIAFARNGKVNIVNVDGTGLTALPVGADYPSWSPDGTRLAVDATAGDGIMHIWVVNADGSNLVLVTTPAIQDGLPRWSPDSRRLVFNRVLEGFTFQIFVINADGTGETQLTQVGGGISSSWPSWSPLP